MEDELSLPKATLVNLIKELLPESAKMSANTQDLIMTICVQFLNHLADQSNNICNGQGRKTITAQHVIEALKKMKFDKYLIKILDLAENDGEGESGVVDLNEKQTKERI